MKTEGVSFRHAVELSRSGEYCVMSDEYGGTDCQGAPLVKPYAYDRYGNRSSVTASGNAQGNPAPTCTVGQTLYVDTTFIQNFYQAALNRQPTATELQSWSDQLRQAYYLGQAQELATASYMGRQIFKSAEYQTPARNNEQFVTDLYWAYLQRAPDSGGCNFWLGQVNANGRDPVREGGFEQSVEFANKVATLCPRGGSAPVPRDGLTLAFDAASNRIAVFCKPVTLSRLGDVGLTNAF
jgi:Domain of unknown function (DUF4214)